MQTLLGPDHFDIVFRYDAIHVFGVQLKPKYDNNFVIFPIKYNE